VVPIVLIVLPLVVLLYLLIFRINQARHYAPQAYYRRKTTGAPVAFGVPALGPRLRKAAPEDSTESEGTSRPTL
jgi:hypothetical protein